ncbi:hypothetical protein EVAR_31554_1 [Eumeta japonica]|uniref:Uncharacterized protein n=1 Tax=Eumeta variegata TaxID=151549 RepID=A0A4C1VAP3_EUMVA|nr:hypothetical protein EVAR_31554_1 [Eumeta japonica]
MSGNPQSLLMPEVTIELAIKPPTRTYNIKRLLELEPRLFEEVYESNASNQSVSGLVVLRNPSMPSFTPPGGDRSSRMKAVSDSML